MENCAGQHAAAKGGEHDSRGRSKKYRREKVHNEGNAKTIKGEQKTNISLIDAGGSS
jgi:hypothetical protein